MPSILDLRPAGLISDPSPFDPGTPLGALREATNVVFRRQGLVEPRPGFSNALGASNPTLRTPYYLVAYDGDVFIWAQDASDNWHVYRASDSTEVTPDSAGLLAPANPDKLAVRAAEARKNLYFVGALRPQKLTSGTDTTWKPMGLDTREGMPASPGHTATVAGDGRVFDNSAAAYRVVFRKKDANGYVIRSAPTGRVLVRTSLSGKQGVLSFYSLPAEVEAGDVIEVYRSKTVTPETAEPSDELFLANEYEITASDIAKMSETTHSVNVSGVSGADVTIDSGSGYTADVLESLGDKITFSNGEEAWIQSVSSATEFTVDDSSAPATGAATILESPGVLAARRSFAVYDNTPDDALGAALYANPSQEGLVRANRPPPAAADAALFRGSLFVADLKYRHRLLLSLVDVGGATDNSGGTNNTTTGIQQRKFTADITSGSNVLANVASFDGIVEGMVVWDGGAYVTGGYGDYFPAGTTIVSYDDSANTITLSANAHATQAAYTNCFASDTVTINGIEYIASSAIEEYTAIADSHAVQIDDGTAEQERLRKTAEELARLINLRDPALRAEVLVADGGSKSTILLERVDYEDTAFSVTTTRTGAFLPSDESTLTSEREEIPNGLAWSKTDQPEAFTALGYARVGSERHRIERIIATRDALFVLKRDGVFRLTGYNEQWRIDPLDPETHIVAPDSVAVIDDRVIMLSNRGVVAVSDGGITPLSEFAIGDTLQSVVSGLVEDPSPIGTFFGVAHPSSDEYLLTFTGIGNDSSNFAYVYNFKTQSWAKWALPASYRHGIHNPADDRLWMCGGGSLTWSVHRNRRGTLAAADEEYDVTVNDVDGMTITIDGGSGWTPAVGDAIDLPTAGRVLVTAVTSSTVFDVSETGATTGSATAYDAFTSTIEWVAKTAKAPHVLKRWMRFTPVWADLDGMVEYDVAFTSEEQAEASSTLTLAAAVRSGARAIRHFVPRNHCVASVLYPKVEITQASVDWELAGFELGFDPISTRLRRDYG